MSRRYALALAVFGAWAAFALWADHADDPTPAVPVEQARVTDCARAMEAAGRADPELIECRHLSWAEVDRAAAIMRAHRAP